MAISFVAGSQITEGAGADSTITGTEPTGTAQDDLVIASVYWEGANLSSAPSGWTTLWAGDHPIAAYATWLGYIVRGASAPSYAWGLSGTPSWEACAIGTFRGVDTTDPVHSFIMRHSGAVSGTADPLPVWTTVEDAWAIAGIYSLAGASGSNQAPTGYTFRAGAATGADSTIYSKALSGFPNRDDPSGISLQNSTQGWGAWSLALRPSGAVTRELDVAAAAGQLPLPSIVAPGAGS